MVHEPRHGRASGRGTAIRTGRAIGLLLGLLAAGGARAEAPATAAGPAWRDLAVVEEIKSWTYPGYTRVVVYLDRRVPFRSSELPADPGHDKPARIVLDLAGARVSPEVPAQLPIGAGALKQARIAQFDKQTARLVLDLDRVARFQAVPFRDPFRVVVDVFGDDPPKPAPQPELLAAPPAADALADLLGDPAAPEPAPTPAARPQPPVPVVRRPAQRVIVVDAGHGGKDPGAIGHKGVYEKHIVLAVARDVAERLRKRGHRVVLTRSNDVFLTLEERTIVANREQADLFVSIHANSSPSRDAHGIETYHLAKASDRRSAEVAARENALAADESDALEELLQALSFSSRQGVSSVLARFVQGHIHGSLTGGAHFRDLGVKGAPFYVLVGTNMAAVLVEVGFVTHPQESRLLQQSSYQGKLAEAIVRGVEEYLAKAGRIPI